MESDKKHKSGLRVTNAITILAFIGVFMVSKSDGLEFTKTPQTYAKYPKWNACTNSSMSFEFKTRQSKALLMYTDDNGRYDFVEVQLLSGKVRLRINIVDGRDGSVDITLGERLNDNKWHMVKIQRNRMETTLYVDAQQDSRVAFGSDFYFGNIATNNFVYFGGLPKNYQSNLKSLSLPSAFFETRFSGSIRNVIYQNCTCMPVRADMVTGMSVSREPKEACEERNGCSAECLCISTDEGPGCQCVDRECSTDTSKYYHLPMDILNGDNLVNPSGLDAKVSGRPITVPGVLGKALKLDGRTQKVKVSGPGHRNECFGDLTLCPEGYTIGLWVKFDKSGSGNGVYMSNGGERVESHGVAMFYRTGRLQWKFRTKTGREWVVTANNMLPRQWYQVMVTWEDKTGLVLYINGEKLAHEDRPSVRVGPTKDGADKMYNDFVIGQSNDGTGSRDLGTMTIDDFQFWSSKMTTSELREKGPIYRYHLSMDQLEYGHLIVPELEPRTRGILQHVPGKIGKAVLIAGSGESIDLGSFSDSCLGNTSLCMYGFTVTFWITFNELRDNSYYMASGVAGFSIFSNGDRLIVNVQNGDRQWRTSTSGIKTDTWYFIEVSWSPTAGLYLYLDQKEMSSQSSSHHQAVKSTSYKNFYIGRANSGMNVEKYGSVTIDHLDLYNADRERLLNIDFIQRGKPQKHYYGFDSMTNGRIHHASTVITTSGKPQLVPGKIGQALRLSGQLQTAIFDHGDGCLGNLDYCKHGALLALWFRPEKFEEGMFYLSSGINGIALAFVDRKVRASAATSTLMWNAMTSELELLTWYYIEVTWHPDTGLKLFANNKLMDKNSYHKAKAGQDTEDLSVMSDKFVLGKDHGEKTGSIYGAATYDEMEFWYGSREYLVAFGYIQRGRPMNYRINMDTILNNGSTLAHPSLSIRLNGKPLLVSGITNNAVHLSGRAQYIDLGVNTDQCLGNLDKCTFGISIFFWVKIDRYDYNMYLLSTGQNGIHISYNNGFLFITLDNKQKSWRISIPKISENVWHLLELSWHPEFGLNFYVDDELQKHVDFITIPYYRAYGSRNFYIGGPNSGDTPGQRFSFANMAVDEMDIWYGRREELLAFGYIIRGNVEYESFSMETASNGVIINPRYHITLERGAKLIPGKVGNAVSLDGRGYVNLGEHMDKCFANVDLCKNGITISMWLNPRTLVNNTYYLSSPTYDLYFENGELKSKFLSNGKSWNVQTKKFRRNQWSNVLLSWERNNGLELFIDGDRVSRDDRPVDLPQGDEPQPGSLYIGKSAKPGTRSPNVLADEVQYFYANLERLRAQGLYGGEIHEVVPLSQMGSSGVLKLPTRTITLEGGATVTRGQHHNAIALSGKNQYINMGENLTCGGNLDNCRQGFTLRFSAKPDKLQNNMYFLDSYPVSIFYKDGKLYSTVRTSSRTWTVAAPGFKAGEWQVVDVSWHPEIGLTMHVNDDEVGAHKTHGTDVEPVFDWDRTTFFGRAMTVMRDERYADTAVENFEVWNVRRDVLVSDNQNGFGLATTQKPRPNTTPPPPVSNDAGHTTKKVFVTNAPGGTTQPINSRPVDTSKIIRFFGSSFIKYDLIQLPSEVRRSVNKESMHLSFYTRSSNGLMWLYIGPDNEKVHISVRDGALLFVMDDGRRLPQQVVVQDPQSRSLMNRWVKVRVEKEGRTLKFYLDDQYVTQVTANENINLLGGGVVYMGGVLQPSVQTGGVISENYNGFLAHVESRKLPAPSREMITNFLQFADTAVRTGDVEFLDRDYWESRKWTWEEVTTPVPERPTPITFKSASSVLVIRDDLDMRRSGSFSFRFRTLEPRGLLAMASGNSQTVQANFIAIEIFDGILYMVYEVGTASSRKHVSNRRVDDGEWHDVVLKVDGNQLIVSLDGQQVPTTLQQADALRMYFFNLYIGGFEDFKRVPWALYSRQGYRGCLESLKVNNIGADLHNFDSKVVGIEVGCRTMTRFCQRQPCVSGFCRDRMDSYACDCANTPFTGQDCDTNAVIASWDGTKSTNFEFLNRDVTHTNDISFRFLTPLRNTLLFKTEVANSNDYIQGELVEGRVKVTMSVGGQTKTFFTGENLNDYFWHTLYIRRRADDIEIQVDNLPKRVGILGGNNFNLKIDRIKFGSLNSTGGTNSFSSNNYIGYMQNFIYGDQELFNQLKKLNSNVKWYLNVSPDNLPLITYKPVTVTTSNTYFQLPPLKMGITMKILFKFKTRESNGLLLYNGGTGKDVIAIELSNGLLRLAYNLGGRNMFSVVQTKTPLNDNEWHTVQVSLDERGQFSLRVDDENLVLSTSDGNQRLELSGALYIAGMPEAMFRKPEVTGLIESRKGFRGCIASMDLNGAVPDLVKFSPEKHLILDRCTDLEMTCKPNACGPGVCVPGVDDYRCDCDMTGYVGRPCNDYPVGYYFGRNGANGMVIYQYPFEKQADSDMDQIAFGFMTEREDGVLYRVQSSLGSDEFIEIRLENGFVIAESNTGGGIIYLAERSKMFNDGKYHVVRYIRTSTNSTLQVDQMPFQSATHTGGASVFNKVYTVMMGGRTDSNGAQIMNFNGIMGGAYYNGHRWFDVLSGGRTIHGKSVERKGDVVLAKPYILVKGGGVKPTIPPPDVYIPPNSEIPGDLGGGGIIIGPEIGGANGGGGPDVIGIGGAGGVTGLFGGAGINVPGEPVPLASAMVGPAPPPLATGARAGAVVGTVLGTLAFMSSLMWALYKLKPGVPTCLSPGAGSAGAGAGGGGMSISQPRATSNLGAVQAASAGGGGAGGGAGAGAGKVTVVNGSAAGGGAGAGGGGGSSTYTSYFQSTSTSVGGAGAGGAGAGGAGAGGAGTDQFDSATLRATGTFSNKGTAIGTPGASRAALGSSSTAYSSNYQSNTMQSYGSGQGSPPVGTLGGVSYERNYMASNDGIPDYDLPVSGTMQSGNSYSSSTLNTHYNYQVQNQRTVAMNRQGQYVLTSSGFSGAVTPGAAADEVRVDCCLMTADGRSVVTGSSIGPPQAWDMQNGELQTIMKGDTVGSTNLHLVCGDRLLVGAVHADMEINEYSGRKGVFNHTLQIWDFQTGKPLSMAEGEYCSAMCPMSDSDKVLFARTDKFGDATSIIAWDLMGNQMIKEMRYDAPVGNNDYVSYLNKSKNDRYVVAGFTNSFDNCAEFMVFDMNLTSYNINEPAMLKLDASPECTAILPKDEAVTGLRNGDLVIWSIRTGQPSRQLLGSGGAHAHSREVKSVTLSEDGKYLVSASADGTLKVWDMNTERPIHTLSGHSDEVCCSAISADNEIVVSGSSDGTIRLWRMKNGTEMCVFNCGIDIFFVTMSHDKGTIVALADKLGARKLIMLQVVRTKIKKIVSS